MAGPMEGLKLRLALLLEFDSGIIANDLHNKLLFGDAMLDYFPVENQSAWQGLEHFVLVFSPFVLLALQNQEVCSLGHLFIG